MRWRGGDGGGIDGDGDVMSAFLYCNECNVINAKKYSFESFWENGENATLPFIDINQ